MPSRPPPVFLPSIRQDIQDIVMWSEDRFGTAAADRYGALICRALRDLQADPLRRGARARPDLALNAFIYHLMFSRDRVSGKLVKTPRHFVVYRFAGGPVEFGRLLHDSRDLARHLPAGYGDAE